MGVRRSVSDWGGVAVAEMRSGLGIDFTAARTRATAEALVTMAIWSSSFVLVELALDSLGPYTIAALRYSVACLILLPLIAVRGGSLRGFSRRDWLMFGAIGVTAYTMGSGSLFFALQFIPATTVSLMGSLSPLLVLVAGQVWLREIPTRRQVLGVLLGLAGMVLFFLEGWQPVPPIGVIIYGVGLVAYAGSTVLARSVARHRTVDSLVLVALPMGVGGGLLVPVALALEGIPHPTLQGLGIVAFLTVANSALGYLLYYHALREITALEMNVIFNLLPLATAGVSWWLLGDRLTALQLGAVVVVIFAVTLVQSGARAEA